MHRHGSVHLADQEQQMVEDVERDPARFRRAACV
jgi:hypothetical protein